MTKFDTLSNEELTFILHRCQAKIDDIDVEAAELEKLAPTSEVEKRFEELAEWYEAVFDTYRKAEAILDSRMSNHNKVFSQIGL